MPDGLQTLVQIFPSTHYVNFAQAILYRGAGFDIVWRSFAAIAGVGLIPSASLSSVSAESWRRVGSCACGDCYT